MRQMLRAMMIALAAALLPAALSTAAAQQQHACDLLTPAEAAAIMNRPEIADAQVFRTGPEAESPNATDCGLFGTGLHVHTELLKNAPGWSAWRKDLIKRGKAKDIPNVGQEAAITKDGNGDYGIVARVGNRIVTVSLDGEKASSESEAKSVLVPLVQAAVKKLQ